MKELSDSLFFDLEVLILSFNKSELTIQLIKSIMHFEPTAPLKITILDQGSEVEELSNLETKLKGLPVNLIKGRVNLGVGGGRQKLLEFASSKWILFLDNDLVFNSPFFHACLKVTSGADFACLPFVEESENNISDVVIPKTYINPVFDRKYPQSVGLGRSSENYSDINHPHVITGIAGGVFLANTQALRNLGGFRGPGRAGYEDLDLTLRVLSKNLKILLIPIATPLTHNKEIENTSVSKLTEFARLDPFELRANARYVENEFKYHVWGRNQYDWLTERAIYANLESQMIKSVTSNYRGAGAYGLRPKILLVCDSPGWAFDRIARKQQNLLAKFYDISITFSNDWTSLKTHLFLPKWDAIIFLWRAPLFQLVRDNLISTELMSKIGYCVYDHQGDMGYSVEIYKLEFLGVPVGVVNESLFEELRTSTKNLALIPDGVDTALFRPFRSKKSRGKKLYVGWSGNVKWGGVDDVKGFSEVIKPCIYYFKKKESPIDFQILDSSKGRLPQTLVAEAMKNWDVVICASKHEGTPNPVLEGLSSGLAVVSTPVGMTHELKREGAQISFIERNSLNLMEELFALEKAKAQGSLHEVVHQNRKVALKFDWRRVLNHHKDFIDCVIQRGMN